MRIKHRGTFALAGGLALAIALIPTSPASADTSQATGQAARVTLLGGSLVTSGTVSASHSGDGSGPDIQSQNPALSVLGASSPITAGLLMQRARANADGTSAACAGLVGTGGSIVIGADGTCTVNTGGSKATIDLGVLALRANAIVAECRADSSGNVTSSVRILGLEAKALLVWLSVPVDSAPNSGLNLLGLLNVTTHATSTPNGAGSIRATALDVGAIAGVLLGVDIGTVTCGANAIAPDSPAIPPAGIPIAAGMVAAVLTPLMIMRRRRPALQRNSSGA